MLVYGCFMFASSCLQLFTVAGLNYSMALKIYSHHNNSKNTKTLFYKRGVSLRKF